MLFDLGRVVMTCGINNHMENEPSFGVFVLQCLDRHIAGDWGDLSDLDKKSNDVAVKEGEHILSSYKYGQNKIWIETVSDRSYTCIMFPDER